MANKLIISNQVSPQYDLSELHGGTTHTKYAVDLNTGSVGGSLEASLGESAAIKYTGIVNVTTPTAVASGLVAGFDTSGVAPTWVMAFYVRCTSLKGAATYIKVSSFHTADTTTHAILRAGESVCIPYSGQFPIAGCKISTDAYVIGVDEATVEVVLAGI